MSALDVRTRRQVCCTCAYCVSFVGLGLLMNMIGPTLPGLAERLGDSSPSSLAPALLARGLGYGLGTIACGQLIDRFWEHAHAFLVVCILVMASASALVPHAGNLPLLTLLWCA